MSKDPPSKTEHDLDEKRKRLKQAERNADELVGDAEELGKEAEELRQEAEHLRQKAREPMGPKG